MGIRYPERLLSFKFMTEEHTWRKVEQPTGSREPGALILGSKHKAERVHWKWHLTSETLNSNQWHTFYGEAKQFQPPKIVTKMVSYIVMPGISQSSHSNHQNITAPPHTLCRVSPIQETCEDINLFHSVILAAHQFWIIALL